MTTVIHNGKVYLVSVSNMSELLNNYIGELQSPNSDESFEFCVNYINNTITDETFEILRNDADNISKLSKIAECSFYLQIKNLTNKICLMIAHILITNENKKEKLKEEELQLELNRMGRQDDFIDSHNYGF